MRINKIHFSMKNSQILAAINQKFTVILFLITISFPVFAQEVEVVLPESFYGNWVEDLSECEAGSYFSIADSEIGLLVFGLGWSSTEVKVENTGDYYTLFVDAISEGGDFQSEIKIKMGEDGNLFFIDSDSEEKELVKCDPTEFFEFEGEEMALADSGLNVMELDMTNTVDVGTIDYELPFPFYGNWVEELSQCEGVPPFSLNYSEDGLLVSGLDWYSTEVKVTSTDDYYTLTINGLSEEGEFDTEIIILLDEDENLIVSVDGGETGSKLVKCDLTQFEEVVELDIEEMGDTGLDVEELDMDNSLALDSFAIELLQGKWQSLEDEASFMVIEGDRMKTYYKRMEDGMEDELIIISDTCMNEADSENDLPKEKNRYISNPNMDMCWYIDFLDATNLSLIYMSRGNFHNYRRVE
jgi:hypothetical protein